MGMVICFAIKMSVKCDLLRLFEGARRFLRVALNGGSWHGIIAKTVQ